MMDRTPVLLPIRPDHRAWHDLADVPSSVGVPAGWYVGECIAGRAQAMACYRGMERVGTMVLRVDEGGEGVIVAGAGRGGGGDLVNTFVPLCEDWLRDQGATVSRVHTIRRGMGRKLDRLGYRLPVEYIYRKGL